MFFTLSKIFWLLAAPSHLWAAGAGRGALRAGGAGEGNAHSCYGGGRAAGAGGHPAPERLGDPRPGRRYPRTEWPAHVDGILVLGAGFDTAALKARGVPATNGGEMRVIAGFEAARRYPAAKLVFSGGSGALGGVGGTAWSEAETARYIFAQMGLDPARLILEPRSRNTYENILFTKALVKPKPGEVWLLVTSPIHMPRAMGIAKKLGWPMLPWPTDYMTGPHGGAADFSIAGNLSATDYAMHEWVGGLVYRLAGKSSGG
jgi:uncharacterized SAM-binding protein YcdF (DUF218 family)